MKTLIALDLLALCLLVTVTFKAVQQELGMRRMDTQITFNGERARLMEDEILTAKLRVQKINTEMAPMKTQIQGLTKKKEEMRKAGGSSDAGVATCNKQKVETEKKKLATAEALDKLKIDQEAEEQKAQQEIENLLKQILDRDVAICAFVDQKQEEGRKLCNERQNGQMKS